MIFFRKKILHKKIDLLIDLEFLFMASWSAVETHSVHRNVGHLFWRNLHLQEAAAEKNNGWEQKRKKGRTYRETGRLHDANAGGIHTNTGHRFHVKSTSNTRATRLRQKHTNAKAQQPPKHRLTHPTRPGRKQQSGPTETEEATLTEVAATAEQQHVVAVTLSGQLGRKWRNEPDKSRRKPNELESMLEFTLALQEPQTDLEEGKQHSWIKQVRFTI